MAHVQACPRVKVSSLPADLIPAKFFEALEHNQQIASCCRHPEEHDIEAFFSVAGEPVPDIYIFHCTCGRKHSRFMCGGGDVRPLWDVR